MSDAADRTQIIHVTMLGGFTLTMGDKILSDNDNRSRKAWNLLGYLIVNRRGDLSINELYSAVWQEGAQENPYGALKTLVFRVRKMMEQAGFPAQDLILSQRGTYVWNPEWKITSDVEQFENLCRGILTSGQETASMFRECMEAFELYKGVFLPKSADENWVGPLCSYYHSLYQKLVRAISEYLLGENEYGKVEEICGKAIEIDRFSEEFHYYSIYAASRRGDQKGALEQYMAVMEMFYRERFITPSEHFKDLYRIISDQDQEVLTDLFLIQDKLIQSGSLKGGSRGAYHCEFAVFKRLVQLESRGVERNGESVYLCLLTVGDRTGRTLKPGIQTRAMERLREAIKDSLRASDAYARYSVSQYMVLLPSATYENSEMVMKRVLNAFNRSYMRKEVSVSYSLDVVLPTEDLESLRHGPEKGGKSLAN